MVMMVMVDILIVVAAAVTIEMNREDEDTTECHFFFFFVWQNTFLINSYFWSLFRFDLQVFTTALILLPVIISLTKNMLCLN